MTEVFAQYGILGAVVICLAGYILRIEGRHKKERKEWLDEHKRERNEWLESHQRQIDRANQVADDTNRTLRENTNILTGLKTLLESKIFRR